MIKIFKIIFAFILIGFVLSCSQVLQTVDLDINTEDKSLQEVFNVVETTLTIKEAKKQKSAYYQRTVLRNGRGENAQPIPEKLALKSKFPKNDVLPDYRIGIGDTIMFSRLIENNRSTLEKIKHWPAQQVAPNYKLGIGDILELTLIKQIVTSNQLAPSSEDDNQNLVITSQQTEETIISKGRIGSDGSVLLLEVGRLEAKGKSLNELRSEARNILIRNGISPRFQLEIGNFKSQKAYITISSTQGIDSSVINLSDQATTLLDVLTQARISYQPGVKTRIKLQRKDGSFLMDLRDIFQKDTPKIFIIDRDHIFVEENLAKIAASSSKVDHKGNIVLEKLGKIKAAGRTLNELHFTIKNLMQPIPDSQNAFQVQITNFASQTALLNSQGKPGVLIPITDTPAKLAEVLTKNGLSIDSNNITQVNLQRNGQTYVFTLDDLLAPSAPYIYVQPEDRITVEVLQYKDNKVFILGGVNPQIFKINPTIRETLADILFTSGGVLSAPNAKRSEVYLLRGTNPVVAYHLDAQSPTRLIVADAMELRPNDILYVAEQTIMSFNRTLETIIPLRILLRDIQEDNVP